MIKGFVCAVLFFSHLLFPLARSDHQTDVWILIDLWKRRLYVMEGSQVKKEFIIGVGKEQTPTPIGKWRISDKSRNWGGGFGPCWLGLNIPWGRYGIHGTNRPGSVGKDSSHGCIRLLNTDIVQLYQMVPVGTRVEVVGPMLGRDEWQLKKLVRGDRGTLVMLIQHRLLSAGYYQGQPDGIFGKGLEDAVKKFQQDHRLPVTGQIQFREYVELGLIE
ncbi:L,D-transpeptidase family protein [Lihuaxuella thermophila]|uniref:Putative peptidoglycan binding domain-containing protein n=1 Tax=Lihuaxuella thermophila TaxID=1173111 RepID=A0A1H8IUB2_9BACL|nr:L,D-transpeptidase family protein [Lihuaxuella thermophila]SEN72052.1 Putative peptidoglycan binding domain-containing protein [Lihuaxuella thermophila]